MNDLALKYEQRKMEEERNKRFQIERSREEAQKQASEAKAEVCPILSSFSFSFSFSFSCFPSPSSSLSPSPPFLLLLLLLCSVSFVSFPLSFFSFLSSSPSCSFAFSPSTPRCHSLCISRTYLPLDYILSPVLPIFLLFQLRFSSFMFYFSSNRPMPFKRSLSSPLHQSSLFLSLSPPHLSSKRRRRRRRERGRLWMTPSPLGEVVRSTSLRGSPRHRRLLGRVT